MKKQLLKIATLSVALVVSASVFGQWAQKTLDFNAYTTTAPAIDGLVDDMWADIDAQDIDQVWKPGDAGEETVSFGDLGATFKATWDLENIYVLVEVDDDNHWNHIDAEVNSWQADKPELYFDVNDTLVDNMGPSVAGSGHYQFAPDFDPAGVDDGFMSAFVVEATGPYVYEYSIPFATLVPKDTTMMVVAEEGTIMSYDITILDLDDPASSGGNAAGMGRINWSNDLLSTVDGGVADESWNCMDQAGVITLMGVGMDPGDTPGTAISNATVNNNMVYPNVASDMIVVNADAAQYEVINSLGQVVMVSETNEFSVASLETGVYFVKANDQVTRILKK